jgi:ABC-type Fe3+-siderophore transport system permease subunit
MKLDARDIKAVADARVTRTESKRAMVYGLISVSILVVGVYLSRTIYASYSSACMLAGCAVGAYYFLYVLDKKQKSERAKLIKEWQENK